MGRDPDLKRNDDFGKRYRLNLPPDYEPSCARITITDGGAEILGFGLPAYSSSKKFGENADLPTNRVYLQRLQDMVDYANKAYEGE
jgi:hypothetical protein